MTPPWFRYVVVKRDASFTFWNLCAPITTYQFFVAKPDSALAAAIQGLPPGTGLQPTSTTGGAAAAMGGGEETHQKMARVGQEGTSHPNASQPRAADNSSGFVLKH